MIGLVLVCWDGTRPAGPPSSHLDKRPAPVECRGMPAPEMGTRREEKRQAGREATRARERMRERANERGTILYEGWRPAGEKRWPEHRGHIPVSREKKYSGSGDGTKRRVAMAQPGRLLASRKRERETVGFPPAFQRLLRLVDRGIIEREAEKKN